jgi:hypothetical protein
MATYTSSGKEVKRDGVRFCDAVSPDIAELIAATMGWADRRDPNRFDVYGKPLSAEASRQFIGLDLASGPDMHAELQTL